MMNAEVDFDRILGKVIKSDIGIQKVILVDRTGLTIAHVSRATPFSLDVDGIGAIASAVFGASEEQGTSLNIGRLQLVTSEFEKGKIFASSCGKGVLCVVTNDEVNIGLVRLILDKAGKELEPVLDEFLRGKPKVEGETAGLDPDDLQKALSALEQSFG